MATTKAPRVKLLTPKFRVNFPKVWEKQVFQEGQVGRYSCVAMFTPSEFSENDKIKWAALQAAVTKLAMDTFKKPLKELKELGYKLPFHRGEEKEQYSGFGPGIIFFTMSAYTRRPTILDRNGEPITQDGPEEFYSGCYARASVNPFVNTKWKSISIGMNNLQKLADGERLDAFSSAEEDFGSDAAEYADDGSDEAAADDGLGLD